MKIVEEKNRFVIMNEGKELGEMTWSDAGENLIIIDHTVVDESLRGQNMGAKLVLKGVEKARLEGKKIIPLCPFAEREFEKNDSYHDVLNK